MKHQNANARRVVSFRYRPGKNGSSKQRNALTERCKTAAAERQIQKLKTHENGIRDQEKSQGLTAVLDEDGVCVVLLEPGQKLTFTGKCSLTCLYGSVRVFGLTIVKNQKAYDLFSPHTHSPLSIEGLKYKKPLKTKKEIRMEVRALLRGYLSIEYRRTVMKSFTVSSSVILLERLEDSTTSFILSHADYTNVFSTKVKERSTSFTNNAVLYSIGVENHDPESGFRMSEDWLSAVKTLVNSCLEEDNGCPVILVCGSKNVGKSTFIRYLMNQLLNHTSSVGYLDCDLGQTEFTPPGCISLMSITEPVLGPPFTHQQKAQKMVYFGETSCEQDMERFVESVKYVITSYKRDEPLLINTMGWVKGFGLLLLIDIIRLLSPSHIIQINAKGSVDMEPLTQKYVQNAPGFLTKGNSTARRKAREFDSSEDEQVQDCSEYLYFRSYPGHHLITIETDFSGAGEAGNVRCHSGILRDLAMLGYLSKLQHFHPEKIIPINSLIPYEVPFNAVALRVAHSDVAPSHIMYSVNASWVGLCRILDDIHNENDGPVILTQTPICDCLGFGIVRGVNMEKKVYYVLTPLVPESLRLVNCLLIGNISVPHAIFKNQPGAKGAIPYVTSEYDFTVFGAGKMKRNKQLKRREHK
ncbi:polynucleotide 5'-hydroxyl-kinase NOL9 [Xenopus laevis]|uniref:Polynucleotide 5'-hydroxyl-kinase NOL9 n=2 Tax=Xenopus laevis TaxID=8355 RepID=A0A974CGE4_XENLA|nr:polynucleotide 5'-hydroxyl-kinase NOL9 [Xenopus laevis]OCT72802.1 hypothetical protein XELAEV_18035784mg [Xenopus laevis]